MNTITIPGLPPELRLVPDVTDRADDDARVAWFDWRGRLIDYRQARGPHAWRRPLLDPMPADRDLLIDELLKCAKDPGYWLAVYGWVFEPRKMPGELPRKPYAPFGFQADLLYWALNRLDDDEIPDGFVSKCRGLGASWIFCALAVWGWRFVHPWDVLLVSRKEELVDKKHHKKSLFWKVDYLIDNMPPWMKPIAYDPDEHRLRMSVTNPANGNAITGESTSAKTGRGDRVTFILYDEAAFMPEGFRDIWTTGAGTTDHRFAVSTESFDEGRDWYESWDAAKKLTPLAVKELEYFRNPYFDLNWYGKEEHRARTNNNIAGFQREYLRDPYAGAGQWIYPTAKQRPDCEEGYEPGRATFVGIDPGHADDTAIVVGQRVHRDGRAGMRWVYSYQKNLVPAEWYAHVITGELPEIGDECWGITASDIDRAAMRFFERLPWTSEVTWVMDPAGSQRHTGLSFLDRVTIKVRVLRQRRIARFNAEGREDVPALRGIGIYAKELIPKADHTSRQIAMHDLLLVSEFSLNREAQEYKDALGERRFNEPGVNATSQPKPVHDKFSHLASAGEYVAVWFHLIGKQDNKRRPDKAERKRAALAAPPTPPLARQAYLESRVA